MKTLLFILLSISCFAQEKYEPLTERFDNGLITTSPWYNRLGRIGDGSAIIYPALYFQYQKYYDYIDIKIVKPGSKLGWSNIFIYTNKGNYSAPYVGTTKLGTFVFRLYFSQKDMWVGIDSGIRSIMFKTVKKEHEIFIYDNLNKLKEYAK